MKKNIAIAVAALLATVCFTGCGTDTEKTSEPASTVAEVTEAPTEAEAEEATEAAEEETKADEKDAKDTENGTEAGEESDSLIDEDALSAIMGTVDVPEYKPEDAAEEDFVGKWEGDCIVGDGTAYNSVFGIPVSAMMRFEINADGTGVMSSDMGDDSGADENQTFKWTYADNAISFAFDNFDEDDEAPASAVISGGQLVISETDGEEDAYVYFKKVTEFSKFDWDSLYDSMGINPDDIAGDLGADTDSAASTAE